MNIQFLASLIKANNRLVIPSLGAFLHKDNGSIVFSPFLNKDDGMLQSAICRRFNVSAVQAQAEIDHFCQTVRTSLSTIGKFYIDEVGILVVNENGGISLIEENIKPVAKEVHEPINVQIPSIEPLLSQINRPQVSTPAKSNVESSFEDVNSVPRPVTQPRVAPQPRPQNIPPRPVAAPRPQPSWVTPTVSSPAASAAREPQKPIAPQGTQPNRSQVSQNQQQRPLENTQQRPMQPKSNQPRQMGQIQGNMAGQPMGNPLANHMTNPAGNPNQPQAQNRPRPAQGQNNAPRKNPNTKPKQGAPKGKNSIDIWLVVAIIAAILVVILIVYGLIYTDPTKQMF